MLTNNQITYMISIGLFLLFCIVVFFILRASRFEEMFKQGKTWQIQLGYIFSTCVISYVLMKVVMMFFELFSSF